MKRIVAVNENNRRIDEDHHFAKLTNAEVEQVRQLHESGFGYKKLAAKFEISVSAAAFICRYERRAQTVARFISIADTSDSGSPEAKIAGTSNEPAASATRYSPDGSNPCATQLP